MQSCASGRTACPTGQGIETALRRRVAARPDFRAAPHAPPVRGLKRLCRLCDWRGIFHSRTACPTGQGIETGRAALALRPWWSRRTACPTGQGIETVCSGQTIANAAPTAAPHAPPVRGLKRPMAGLLSAPTAIPGRTACPTGQGIETRKTSARAAPPAPAPHRMPHRSGD